MKTNVVSLRGKHVLNPLFPGLTSYKLEALSYDYKYLSKTRG